MVARTLQKVNFEPTQGPKTAPSRRRGLFAPKVKYADSKEAQALFRALKHRNTKDISHMLECGEVEPDIKGKHGDTPLVVAVENEDVGLVKLFLEHNANPNARTSLGFTPLMIAIRRNTSVETIDVLLEGGAKVRAWNYLLGNSLDEARWAPWLVEKNPQTYQRIEQQWREESLGHKAKEFFSKPFRK